MKLVICEKWTQRVSNPTEKWFLDYAVRSPRDAGVHLTAGWCAYRALKGVHPEGFASVTEYFGGIGAQSLMIQELFSPQRHEVMDNSAEAVQHIRSQVKDVKAWQADSYDPGSYVSAELVGLDFGDLTVWKTRPVELHRKLLDRVFAGEPRGVVLTDVACRYLHLHRQRYEALLGAGTCETYEGYLNALATRIEDMYGYRMVGGFMHRWSTVMALSPAGHRVHRAEFIPTPANPVGLQVNP